MKKEKLKKFDHLLSGIKNLTEPDYHKLNKYSGRNDRLLHAVLCAYVKHHLSLDNQYIRWNQLRDILLSAILNEIGDDKFNCWIGLITEEDQNSIEKEAE